MKTSFFIISLLFFSQVFSQTSIWTLINNPDFETYNNCPTGGSNVNNDLVSWVQASDGTSDYFNTSSSCGFTSSFNFFNTPPNSPNGDGFIGFSFWNFASNREYIGTCLTNSLTTGDSYTMEFSLFPASGSGLIFAGTSSLNPTIAVYGNVDCSKLPFTGSGIPPASDGWILLGSQSVNLSVSQWTDHQLNFMAPSDISAIIIGGASSIPPGSGTGTGGQDHYYFFDYAGPEIPSQNAPIVFKKHIEIPNVFTPNGDGSNETFRINQMGIDNFLIKIYNRWGNVVFESTDMDFEWDGTNSNGKLPTATYYYTIEATYVDGESENIKGTISLFI